MFRKNIKIADIRIGEDRRPVHYETVKGIAESFKAVGQMQPIAVDEADNLVFGRHRVEAAKLCEWKTIEANVVESGPEADLMEADENLQRHGLDGLQFSRAVAARKRAWEAINGRPKPGPKNGKIASPKGDNSVNFTEFKEQTAAVAGVSLSTVEKALAIGEKLTEEAAEILEDTKAADNKTVLAQVAALPPSKQPAAAKRAAAGKPVVPKAEPEADHWLDPLQAPYEEAVSLIQKTKRIVKSIAELEKDGAHLAHLGTFRHIDANLKEAETHIKANKPAAGCPKCGDEETRGKGCKSCYGCGFISQVVHKGLTAKVG